MTQYVAFLRGVNVGGITLKMADLRAALAGLGHTDVRTVLASGNVVLGSDENDRAALKQQIETCLRETFGYDAWIVLLSLEEVRAVADAYPFDPSAEGRQPYVVLGSDHTVLDTLAEAAGELDPAVERVQPGDGVLYWEVERGKTLQSAFGKRLAKARFKPSITTRNLRTLHKILA